MILVPSGIPAYNSPKRADTVGIVITSMDILIRVSRMKLDSNPSFFVLFGSIPVRYRAKGTETASATPFAQQHCLQHNSKVIEMKARWLSEYESIQTRDEVQKSLRHSRGTCAAALPWFEATFDCWWTKISMTGRYLSYLQLRNCGQFRDTLEQLNMFPYNQSKR